MEFSPDVRPASVRSTRPLVLRLASMTIAVVLVATACGGGDSDDADNGVGESTADTVADDGGSDNTVETTTADTETTDDSSADEAPTDDAAAPSAGESISWTAPDGNDYTTVAISPDGATVALGFNGPPGLEATPGVIVAFDVATGSEAWRADIEDVGFLGLNLVFTSAGVTAVTSGFEGGSAVTYVDGAITSEVVVGEDECAQFLNGTVDPSAPRYFTVIPGAVCQVDVTTGASAVINLSEATGLEASQRSIRFDTDGALVASYEYVPEDGFFEPEAAVVDPDGFTVIEPTTGREEPPSAADRFGDRLEEGDLFASTESRVAQTPDGSIVALVQPDRIDLVG